MKKRLLNRFTPFVKLSRGRQRDLYVSLRWKIKRDTDIYGGKFTSHLVLNEPDRPMLYNQWFSCCFLGSDGITIWNAMIVTAADEFLEEVGTLASDRVISLLTKEQIGKEYGLHWEPPFYKNGQKYYRMVEREEQKYDCFGGLTRRAYKEKIEHEIIKTAPPVIYESFSIDRNYRYGTGLRAIVLADEINGDVIETTIERFRQAGEKSWQCQHPVSRDTLPVETKNALLSKVKYQSSLLGLAHRN